MSKAEQHLQLTETLDTAMDAAVDAGRIAQYCWAVRGPDGSIMGAYPYRVAAGKGEKLIRVALIQAED